ncbi:hypothetical protein QBC40DRAFT_256165 [Triangularia verruculosa]|uniref:Uncharacterized protein n=1 Tax=Triangularia verruculosa TaxID=2587418 RepID=A0AAN7ARC9_9PEZI|nr:hypothetical protein QBC40DRAFT_256165 [Triangularia verruculosa]
MRHSHSSTAAGPSSSLDQHKHHMSSSYGGHDYENLLRARELRRQQAREYDVARQQQSAQYWQAKEEQDLAKALEDSFITETAHRLFLKNKQREEDRVRKAQEDLFREQHRQEVDRARERYYIDQYYQHQKEKAERREKRKERKAQQKQQQQQHQHVSFATPSSDPATPTPVPSVSSPSSTYSTLTTSSNGTEEISNPDNKQLVRLEKRFQLRRPSPENDNPNTGKEVYHNPFMQPASRAYFYTPPSRSGTTSPTISLSTLPPRSPARYLRHDPEKEREISQREIDRQRAQDKVKDWMGGREHGTRYRSNGRFQKETRRSRSRSRAGRYYGDGYHETVWEKEERETKVEADDWVYRGSR